MDTITEAKDLKVLTMNAPIGNIKTHENTPKKESNKEKSLVLKISLVEVSSEEI